MAATAGRFTGRQALGTGQYPALVSVYHATATLARRNSECPRQELNLAYDLRKVACLHHTPGTAESEVRGCPGGIEPAAATVTESHACRYNTNTIGRLGVAGVTPL